MLYGYFCNILVFETTLAFTTMKTTEARASVSVVLLVSCTVLAGGE